MMNSLIIYRDSIFGIRYHVFNPCRNRMEVKSLEI